MKFYDAFISYGRADSKTFATKLHKQLEARGLNIWFDQNDIPPGVDYQKKIDDGIEKAHNFLFIISPHSVNSPHCLKEIELAVKLNKRIIPLLHVKKISYETWKERNPDKTEKDWEEYQKSNQHLGEGNPKMHPKIQKNNWVLFEEKINDFDKSLTVLTSAIKKHENYVQQHTNFLVKALSWDRNQQQKDYLLDGEEIEAAEKWLKHEFIDEQPPCIPTYLHRKFISVSTKRYDAFISYGRADSKDFATKLHKQLEARGLNIWFDQNDIPPGVDYQKQIDDGIEKAHNFLFIISPHSVNSPHCLKEIELAVKLNKRIIPLLHVKKISYETWKERNPDKTEKDWEEYQKSNQHLGEGNPKMHPKIQKNNWVLFEEKINDFDKSLTVLISAIKKHENYVKQHTNFLVKALEWQRNQQPTNYLLVEEERQKAETWLKQRFTDEQPPCIPTDLHCEYICESIKNANNLLTQVFLASSEQDEEIKEKIRKTLMRESITVWTNKTDIKTGSEFQEAINQGIEGADNFFYFISLESLKSKYCQQELNLALANYKRIIPLLIENDLKLIPTELKKIQFIDFTESDNQEKYQISADKLLQELKKEPSYYENHKLLLVKAKKWQRKNKHPSLLLRGYNLQVYETWLKVAKQREDYPPLPLQEEFITASLNQPAEYSLEVFISYSRTDSDLARKLNDHLQEIGKTTWFDQESIAPGTDFQKEIYRGIEHSDNFVFIISPESVNSPYCADEVKYAQKLNKRIVTILHRPLSAEYKQKLPSALAAVQWLNFNKNEGEFSANFNELVRTLDTDRDHIKGHTKWLQRALEWEKNKKNNKDADLLLRGIEFASAQEWLKTAEIENKNPVPTELQKEFIDKSRKAIEARKKQERRQILVLRSLLVGVSFALVVAFFQWRQSEINQAESLGRYSLSLFKEEGKDLEAVVTAIKAGKILHTQHTTKPEVLNALQKSRFEIRERDRLEGNDQSLRSVSFSPDGKRLASGSTNKNIKIWNLETGKKITLQGHNYVNSLSFSPNEKILASGGNDGVINLWNIETGKALDTLKFDDNSVRSVSFSPDGKMLASGGDDNTIKIWNLETKQKTIFTGHNQSINAVSFSPDGKTLASGSDDNTIKLWNFKTGKKTQTLKGHKESVVTLSFSPDGKTLASGSDDNTIKLWNFKTGKEISILKGHSYPVRSVSFSPDGKTLASGSYDNTIKLWDVKTGKEISTLKGHSNHVNSVSFNPVVQILASGSNDTTIKIWNLDINKEIKTLTGHNQYVQTLSLNKDTLASAGDDNNIKLWDLKTGNLIRTLTGHIKSINSVIFSKDGRKLVSGGDGKTIEIWDVETGKKIQSLTGDNGYVHSLSISPDGQILAADKSDDTIQLWDIETGNEIHSLQGHNKSIKSVSFSPDGKILASGSVDKTIKLWNLETGNLINTLEKHNSVVSSVSFSPDGKTLASGSVDNTIKLWDVKTGKEIRTLEGHNEPVRSVSFSPDGKTLASGSDDMTIKLWDVKTGKEIRTLKGHDHYVNSVSFSPDGKTVVSGSADNTVKLWDLEELKLDTLLRKNCDFVRGFLANNPLKNNPDVKESDRSLCDGWYSKQ